MIGYIYTLGLTRRRVRVYKKDNKFYHRDQLHKGKSAHLEVYDKRGKHIGIANPLTGELLEGTAIQGRELPM